MLVDSQIVQWTIWLSVLPAYNSFGQSATLFFFSETFIPIFFFFEIIIFNKIKKKKRTFCLIFYKFIFAQRYFLCFFFFFFLFSSYFFILKCVYSVWTVVWTFITTEMPRKKMEKEEKNFFQTKYESQNLSSYFNCLFAVQFLLCW